MNLRPGVSAILALCSATLLVCSAADFSSYRGFEFGSSVAVTAKLAGVNPSEVRTVHKRPALIQELEWRPGSAYSPKPVKADPIGEVLFRFSNDALFQIVTTYERQSIEGMAEADMITAISRTYGIATKPAGEIAYRSNYGETASVLARWENPGYSYSLVRTGDRTSYALILTATAPYLAALASIAEGRRLDAVEAPQRAIDLERSQAAGERQALDKARALNLPNFQP